MPLRKHFGRAMRNNKFFVLFFLLLVLPYPAPAKPLDSLYQAFVSNFDFLPEYYLKFDFSTFAFKKDLYFQQQYLAESNTGLEFAFISFRQLLYSIWDVKFKIGLGDIPGNQVFSVLNIHFNINPTFELRLARLNIIAGLEHQCVHEVDRKNYPVVFWNAPFVALGSKNMRVNQFWIPLGSEDGWTLQNRFAWYICYVNFIQGDVGIGTPEAINGNNPYLQEGRLDTRFAFYRRKSWIVTVHNFTRIGQYQATANVADHGGIYWREEIGIESYFRRGKRGAAIFGKYIRDDLPPLAGLPVFSKDRLLEFGVSFFN
jgi:hypothetical protein